jgi:hypothetical protein
MQFEVGRSKKNHRYTRNRRWKTTGRFYTRDGKGKLSGRPGKRVLPIAAGQNPNGFFRLKWLRHGRAFGDGGANCTRGLDEDSHSSLERPAERAVAPRIAKRLKPESHRLPPQPSVFGPTVETPEPNSRSLNPSTPYSSPTRSACLHELAAGVRAGMPSGHVRAGDAEAGTDSSVDPLTSF